MANSRIDIIGQNGNDGEHYDELTASIKPQTLIDIIGYRASISMTEAFGGRTIRIPLDVKDDSSLTLVVGLNEAMVISKKYGGHYITVPAQASLIRSWRNQEINRRYHKDQESVSELSRSTGLSRRMIKKIVTAELTKNQPGRM